ncbi:MAG: LamG-like jellyroll fold domain-containing protein [Saprospiraceae bacterium]
MKTTLQYAGALLAICIFATAQAQTLQPYHFYNFEGDVRIDQGSAGTMLQPEGQPFQTTDRFGGEFKALNTSQANVFIQDGTAFQGSFTVSVWYRATGSQNPPYAGFWGIEDPTNSPGITDYGMHSNFGANQMEFEGGGRKMIVPGSPLEYDQWKRVTCVQDTSAKTRKIYVNGVDQGGDSISNYDYFPPELDAKVVFGRKSGSPASYRLYGSIDDVQVFDRALSAVQIDSSYRADADLIAPSAPSNLRVTYVGAPVDQIVLQWDLSTDDSGIEKYTVFLDDASLGDVQPNGPSRGIANPGLDTGDVLVYKIVSKDWTGNVSDTATISWTFGGNVSSTQSLSAAKLSISPNPVRSDVVYVRGLSEATQLDLYSATGQLIERFDGLGADASLDFAGLPKGMYVLRFYSPAFGVVSRRLVRQ